MENLKQLGDEASRIQGANLGELVVGYQAPSRSVNGGAIPGQASKQLQKMSKEAKAVKHESTESAPAPSAEDRERITETRHARVVSCGILQEVKPGRRDFGCQTVFRLGGMAGGLDILRCTTCHGISCNQILFCFGPCGPHYRQVQAWHANPAIQKLPLDSRKWILQQESYRGEFGKSQPE